MQRLGMDSSFASRHLNQGFSGGEKKRNEILQMALLKPRVAVLDETDSGLDIDALRVVGRGVHAVREERPELGVLAITHYQRLLDELIPDVVHLLVDGRIVLSGGAELAKRVGDRRVRGLAMTTTTPLERRSAPQGLPAPRPGRCTTAPSCISIQPPPPCSPRRSSTPWRATTRRPTPTSTAASTPPRRSPRTSTSRPGVVVGRLIGAPDPAHEIVFTKNTTESINLVAHTWARTNLKAGDRILLTEMEHHANIVPWLMLAEEVGLEVRYIPLDGEGRLDLTDLTTLLEGVKLVGVSAMSNVLGTINPVAEIAGAAHSAGALVLVDGAQLVPHAPVDVTALGADFLAFSGHKMMGPTGIGVLWARRRAAQCHAAVPRRRRHDPRREARLVPGGAPPGRFEAGTPPIAEAVGLSRRRRLPERNRDGPDPGPRA